MRLSEMPAEILLETCSYLAQDDLWRALTTCRRVSDAARGCLYRHPVIEGQRWANFATVVKADPVLGQQVASLSWSGFPTTDLGEVSSQDGDRRLTLPRCISLKMKMYEARGAASESVFSFLDRLAVALPSLRHLEVDNPGRFGGLPLQTPASLDTLDLTVLGMWSDANVFFDLVSPWLTQLKLAVYDCSVDGNELGALEHLGSRLRRLSLRTWFWSSSLSLGSLFPKLVHLELDLWTVHDQLFLGPFLYLEKLRILERSSDIDHDPAHVAAFFRDFLQAIDPATSPSLRHAHIDTGGSVLNDELLALIDEAATRCAERGVRFVHEENAETECWLRTGLEWRRRALELPSGTSAALRPRIQLIEICIFRCRRGHVDPSLTSTWPAQ